MEECCNNERHAHHSEDLKRSLINRISRIEGQIRAVKKMISEDVYCDDVITLIAASKHALNSLSRKLFEAHLKSCIFEQISAGTPEIMDELLETVRKMQKN